MKIIKDGKIPITIIRFRCDKCGCIFEADKDEYRCSLQMEVLHDGLGNYKCQCPCCNQMVYADKR